MWLWGESRVVIKGGVIWGEVLERNEIGWMYGDGSFRIGGGKDKVMNRGGMKIEGEEMEKRVGGFMGVGFVVSCVGEGGLGEGVRLVIGGEVDGREVESKLERVVDGYDGGRDIFMREWIGEREKGKREGGGWGILGGEMKKVDGLMFGGRGREELCGESVGKCKFLGEKRGLGE